MTLSLTHSYFFWVLFSLGPALPIEDLILILAQLPIPPPSNSGPDIPIPILLSELEAKRGLKRSAGPLIIKAGTSSYKKRFK